MKRCINVAIISIPQEFDLLTLELTKCMLKNDLKSCRPNSIGDKQGSKNCICFLFIRISLFLACG